MDRIDEIFGPPEEEERYYPGSKTKIPEVAVPPPPQKSDDAWDARPIKLKVKGTEREFFTIGMLAKALNRSAATVRDWENHGILPPARFRTASKDPKKAKRLYTREQCEGVIKIAHEEGLMAQSRAGGLRRDRIPDSFPGRIVTLFKELESK